MISVHKMKQYPSRMEIPTQTTRWANLVSIMLNEKKIRSKKAMYYVNPFIRNSQDGKTVEREGRS